MTLKRLLMVLAIFLISFACTSDPIVHDPESLGFYDLKCNISPGGTQPGAILGFIKPEDLPIDTHGATVTISGEEQQITLNEIKPGFYAGVESSTGIKHGRQYKLSATCPDGTVLTGIARTPGSFKIIKPPSDTLEYVVFTTGESYLRYHFIPPKISWTKSQHALSYTLLARRKKFSVDTTAYLPEESMTYYFANNPDANSFVEKIEIAITANDSNFMPYHNPYGNYHSNSDDPYGENSRIDQVFGQLNLEPGINENIIGGTGYFISSYTITDSIIIRYKREHEEE